MENLLAHEFIERREKFFRLRASDKTEDCEVAVQSLFNWVMSSIESIYWGDDFIRTAFDVTLYVQGDLAILAHTDRRSCKELRFRFKQGYTGNCEKVLRKFVELFNKTNFSKHKYTFSDPVFHANGPVTAGSSRFEGCYYVVYIHIDMRSDIRERDRVR